MVDAQEQQPQLFDFPVQESLEVLADEEEVKERLLKVYEGCFPEVAQFHKAKNTKSDKVINFT